MLEYTDHVKPGAGRFDVEAVTHILRGPPGENFWGRGVPVGTAFLFRNRGALPRARLMGRPVYAESESAAVEALDRLGASVRDRLVVEDPTRPLPPDRAASGSAAITRERAEHVEVRTDSPGPAYLVLADTFDPGWTATLDGRATAIRPAFVAFRAVFVPAGRHTVVFRYRPSGFALGRSISACGLAAALVLLVWRRKVVSLAPEHQDLNHSLGILAGLVLALALVVASSTVTLERSGRPALHPRWRDSLHRFTWGAGIEAMHLMNRGNGGRPFGPSHP
jgi:hypothetical protein